MGDEPKTPAESTTPPAAGAGAAVPEASAFKDAADKVENSLKEAISSVRKNGQETTRNISKWLDEKEVFSEETSQTLVPLAAAATTGIIGLGLYNTLGKMGKSLTNGIRNIVTGGGYLEEIPLVGGLFTLLGKGVDLIGDLSGAIITGAISIFTFKAFALDKEPEKKEPTGASIKPSGALTSALGVAAFGQGLLLNPPKTMDTPDEDLRAVFAKRDDAPASAKTMRVLERELNGPDNVTKAKQIILEDANTHFSEEQARRLAAKIKGRINDLYESNKSLLLAAQDSADVPGVISRLVHKIPGVKLLHRGYQSAEKIRDAVVERAKGGLLQNHLEGFLNDFKAAAIPSDDGSAKTSASQTASVSANSASVEESAASTITEKKPSGIPKASEPKLIPPSASDPLPQQAMQTADTPDQTRSPVTNPSAPRAEIASAKPSNTTPDTTALPRIPSAWDPLVQPMATISLSDPIGSPPATTLVTEPVPVIAPANANNAPASPVETTPVKPPASPKPGFFSPNIRPGYGTIAGVGALFGGYSIATDENATPLEKGMGITAAGAGGTSLFASFVEHISNGVQKGANFVNAERGTLAVFSEKLGGVASAITAPVLAKKSYDEFQKGNNFRGTLDGIYSLSGSLFALSAIPAAAPLTLPAAAATAVAAGTVDGAVATYDTGKMVYQTVSTYNKLDDELEKARTNLNNYKNLGPLTLPLSESDDPNDELRARFLVAKSYYLKDAVRGKPLEGDTIGPVLLVPENYSGLRQALTRAREILEPLTAGDNFRNRYIGWFSNDKALTDAILAKRDIKQINAALAELEQWANTPTELQPNWVRRDSEQKQSVGVESDKGKDAPPPLPEKDKSPLQEEPITKLGTIKPDKTPGTEDFAKAMVSGEQSPPSRF